MSFDNFKYLGDHKNECIYCGETVDSGIRNLVNHTSNCDKTKDALIDEIVLELAKERRNSEEYKAWAIIDGELIPIEQTDMFDKAMREVAAENLKLNSNTDTDGRN